MNNTGEKIRLTRKKRKLSQSQLALKLKVNKQTISQYENNKINISTTQLRQIAKILKISLNYLLKNDNDNDNIETEISDNCDIGYKIKIARIEKGLTQKQLAKKLGVSQGTINKYELSQREISLLKLRKISKIFNMSLCCLICEEKEYICKSYIVHIKKIIYIPIFKNINKGELLEDHRLPIIGYLPIEKGKIRNRNISGTFQVISDSMEPEILKGTYALINNQAIIKQSNITMVYIKEKGILIMREIQFLQNNMIKLIPYNKKYPTENYEIKDVILIGKIVGKGDYYIKII